MIIGKCSGISAFCAKSMHLRIIKGVMHETMFGLFLFFSFRSQVLIFLKNLLSISNMSSSHLSDCVLFNNGIECPILGFGTWRTWKNDTYKAVKSALEAGYRHIDTASMYANEQEVGQAINEKIEQSLVKREEVFVVSKLSHVNHEENMVVPALKKSLELLNLEYIDLYLIHAPWSTKPHVPGKENDTSEPDNDGEILSDVDPVETWKGMEQCVKQGLAKSIGVSNFNSKQIQNILDMCKIKPVTNQVECHPLLNQERFLGFLKQHDIVLTGYRPLGGANGLHLILGNDKVVQLAKKYKKTPAQIIVRWNIQRGIVVIPKSGKPERIKENCDVFDFSLSDEDVNEIMTLHNNTRFCKHTEWKNSKHFFLPSDLEF